MNRSCHGASPAWHNPPSRLFWCASAVSIPKTLSRGGPRDHELSVLAPRRAACKEYGHKNGTLPSTHHDCSDFDVVHASGSYGSE